MSNYTLIGYTEDTSFHDRCGDYHSQPGAFERYFYREDDQHMFIWRWAVMKQQGFDELIAHIDGVPQDQADEDEYWKFDELEKLVEVELQRQLEEKAKKEQERKRIADAEAARKAEQQRQEQREKDLAQLEALKRKLGV